MVGGGLATDVATFWPAVVFLAISEANKGGSASVSHSRRHSWTLPSPPLHRTHQPLMGQWGSETAHVASLVPPNKNKA